MTDTTLPPRRITLMAVGFEAGLGVVACVIGWLLARSPVAWIGWDWLAIAWGAAATLPLLMLLWIVAKIPFAPFIRLRRLVDELVVPLFADCGYFELLQIAAAAGIGEELLFRGLVQPELARLCGWPTAWIAASVLFGLLHFLTATYAILAGLVGAYLGGLALASDNLLLPIVVHGLYDFLALVYLVRWRKLAARPAGGIANADRR